LYYCSNFCLIRIWGHLLFCHQNFVPLDEHRVNSFVAAYCMKRYFSNLLKYQSADYRYYRY